MEGDQDRNPPGAVTRVCRREEIVLSVGNVEPVNILLIGAHRIEIR